MAKQTVTKLIDDLDGSNAESTVSYTWDGTAYEIDLSKKNAAAFRKAIGTYVSASRKVGRVRGATAKRAGSVRTNSEQLQAIREWARSNGYEIADRGRISAAIQEAYIAS